MMKLRFWSAAYWVAVIVSRPVAASKTPPVALWYLLNPASQSQQN
jgi:hypothetical protein